MCGLARHEARARRASSCSRWRISSLPTCSFSANTSPGTDRLDDAGRAPLLAHGGVGVVGVLGGADVQDRSAAGHRRDLVSEQRSLGEQDTRGTGAADELVRRDEHSVLVGEVPIRDRRRRVHVDREVRSRGRVVEAGEGAMPVKRDGDPVDVAHDAGHVRRGGEAAELDRAVGVAAQFVLEVGEIDSRRRRPGGSSRDPRPTRATEARWSGVRRDR